MARAFTFSNAPGVFERASVFSLVGSAWISGAVFGLYILAHFGGALADGEPDRWNGVLRLYNPAEPAATVGIGVHFLAGAVLLLAGPLQLIPAVRARYPAFHRWTGRLYALSGLLAGAGGLVHIAFDRTIGGPVMDVGFAIYGVLMALCSVMTVRAAMQRRFEAHRAFAIRLFALAVGSWLYRLEYGLWEVFAGGLGRADDFRGWFDYVMDFFFFAPNLLIAELFIRSRAPLAGAGLRLAASLAMAVGAGLIAVSTWFFTAYIWGPAILAVAG